VAPAHDRLRELVGPGRGQEDHRVGRGFLEDLQEHVGRGRVQPVGLADQEHLPAGLDRGAMGGVPHALPHRVDVDVAPLGLD
jgi:hypothetical protein